MFHGKWLNPQPAPPPPVRWRRPSIRSIIKYSAAIYDVSMADMIGRRRDYQCNDARRIAILGLMRFRPELSTFQIGEALHRERTTIIFLRDTARVKGQRDPVFAENYAELIKYFAERTVA